MNIFQRQQLLNEEMERKRLKEIEERERTKDHLSSENAELEKQRQQDLRQREHVQYSII